MNRINHKKIQKEGSKRYRCTVYIIAIILLMTFSSACMSQSNLDNVCETEDSHLTSAFPVSTTKTTSGATECTEYSLMGTSAVQMDQPHRITITTSRSHVTSTYTALQSTKTAHTTTTRSTQISIKSTMFQAIATTTNVVTEIDTEVIAEELLRFINAEREALGLPLLNTAPIAHEIATVRARELQEEWSHYRPASSKYLGTTVASLYTEFTYGEKTNNEFAARDSEGNTVWIPIVMPPLNSENISGVSVPVADSTVESIASVIVEGFRGSSGHWQDLMNDAYTGVGIGVTIRTVGDQGQWYEVHTAVLTMSRVYG